MSARFLSSSVVVIGCLTTNLQVTSGDAIDINTNEVTLDLNGFTVSSTEPVATGVAMGCSGQSTTAVGIYAHIANSCVVSGGTTNITYKYNMP